MYSRLREQARSHMIQVRHRFTFGSGLARDEAHKGDTAPTPEQARRYADIRFATAPPTPCCAQGESARVRCRSPAPDTRVRATTATLSNGHRLSPASAAVRPASAFAARQAT